MNEPILRAEDHDAWETWERAARIHASTLRHRRVVDAAKRVAVECLNRATNAAVMWSGGKDSTAMTHLVCVELGAKVAVLSEKDDLDYPGEVEYITRLARAWGADLRIVTPSVSPAEWMATNAAGLDACADMHSRASALSKACFYDVVERVSAHFCAIFLGLRAEESRGRRMNRRVRGPLYTTRVGQVRCTPIVDWRGIDVFAYLVSRSIEPLHVYRCIGFKHDIAPWVIRKSWWIPGAYAGDGEVAWLSRYYPSLYRKLTEWMPHASLLR